MKKKKISLTKIKNKCWKLFSLMVRLEETDKNGYGNCVSCGRTYHYKQFQCGHFIAGRNNSILFERNACHIQCYGCNIGKAGNIVEYYQWMKEKFGEKEIDRLRILAKQPRKFTIWELEEFAIKLTLKTTELLQAKNG